MSPAKVAAYEQFRESLFSRHQGRLTSWGSSAADVVITAGVVAAAVTRRPQLLPVSLALGFATGTAAHLFQPGSLRPELSALRRHPLWSARAEVDRFWSQFR